MNVLTEQLVLLIVLALPGLPVMDCDEGASRKQDQETIARNAYYAELSCENKSRWTGRSLCLKKHSAWKHTLAVLASLEKAEREGFEPSVGLRPHRFSRPARSAALAPLRTPRFPSFSCNIFSTLQPFLQPYNLFGCKNGRWRVQPPGATPPEFDARSGVLSRNSTDSRPARKSTADTLPRFSAHGTPIRCLV